MVYIGDYHQYVLSNIPTSYGINEGLTGILIWLCHYACYTKNEGVDKYVDSIWMRIQNATFNEMLPLNFKHGILGVGWAILYLYSNQLIENIPDEYLDYIDKKINLLNLNQVNDYSFFTGIGGLYAYLSLRLSLSDKMLVKEDFLKCAELLVLNVITENPTETATNYYAIYYLLLRRNRFEEYKLKVDLFDWAKFSAHISNRKELWNTMIFNGCISTLISAINCKINREEV